MQEKNAQNYYCSLPLLEVLILQWKYVRHIPRFFEANHLLRTVALFKNSVLSVFLSEHLSESGFLLIIETLAENQQNYPVSLFNTIGERYF